MTVIDIPKIVLPCAHCGKDLEMVYQWIIKSGSSSIRILPGPKSKIEYGRIVCSDDDPCKY